VEIRPFEIGEILTCELTDFRVLPAPSKSGQPADFRMEIRVVDQQKSEELFRFLTLVLFSFLCFSFQEIHSKFSSIFSAYGKILEEIGEKPIASAYPKLGQLLFAKETDQEEGAPMRRCQIVQDQEDNTLVKCLETGDTAGFFDGALTFFPIPTSFPFDRFPPMYFEATFGHVEGFKLRENVSYFAKKGEKCFKFKF
jgi:hypothetical protein